MSRRLRYQLRCSIGELEEAPGATAPLGYTDDLAVAVWHAEHSPYPGWGVYDVIDGEWVGGDGPPEEHLIAQAIQRLIGELTVPGWHKYPYAPVAGDVVGRRHREEAAAEHLEKYPMWRPVPEYVVGPLRAALYRAKGLERQVAEQEPPAPLAAYPDGRDLTRAWRLDEDGFEAWAGTRGFAPLLKGERVVGAVSKAVASRDESLWRFRERVYDSIGEAFFEDEAVEAPS